MAEKKESYGTIKLYDEHLDKHITLQMENYVIGECEGLEKRVEIVETDKNTYVVTCHGKSTQSMHLTKETLVLMMTIFGAYTMRDEFDMAKAQSEIKLHGVQISSSDNISLDYLITEDNG